MVAQRGCHGEGTTKGLVMSGIGDATDKAKQYAQDNPEKVDQAKDKAKDVVDGQKDKGDGQGGEKQPQ